MADQPKRGRPPLPHDEQTVRIQVRVPRWVHAVLVDAGGPSRAAREVITKWANRRWERGR